MATGIAYQEQSSSDLKNFLDARAAELAPGGLLCFAGLRRTHQEPNRQVVSDHFPLTEMPVLDIVDEDWHELLAEGIITEEQSTTLNSPSYCRTIEEVLQVLEGYSSELEVLTAKATRVKMFVEESGGTINPVKAAVGLVKGIAYSFLESHLGKEVNQILWHRVEQTVKKMPQRTLNDFTEAFMALSFVALIRKG